MRKKEKQKNVLFEKGEKSVLLNAKCHTNISYKISYAQTYITPILFMTELIE